MRKKLSQRWPDLEETEAHGRRDGRRLGSDLKRLQGGGFRARMRRFGGRLAGMIVPRIGALVAWGLFAAFFNKPNDLITHRLPLDRVHDAIDTVAKGAAIKVTIEP